MPKTAGILSIVSGAIFVLVVIIGALFFSAVISGIAVGFGTPSNAPFFIIPLIALPLLAIGIVAIVGGIAARRYRNWGLALAGSICSLFCFLFLGIPSLIFIIAAKSEFTRIPSSL